MTGADITVWSDSREVIYQLIVNEIETRKALSF